MEGGTTFHFVTDGIDSALSQARAAAGDGDISVGGGAETIRAHLNAGHIDELRLHVAPEIVGAGERLFDGVAGVRLTQVESVGTDGVTHLRLRVEKRVRRRRG